MKKIFIIIFLISGFIYSDNNNFIYLDGINYHYIDYLINNGSYSPRFVFQQPYRISEFEKISNVKMYNKWNYLFKNEKILMLMGLDNSYCASKNIGEHFYSITAGGHYSDENIILGNRFSLDETYKFDEFYPGDLSESGDWLYGRVNDAYMDILLGNFNLFVGRIKRNWGSSTFPGLMISDNPYSYDQIKFAYSTDYFRISMLYSRLDDSDFGLEFMSADSIYLEYSDVKKHIVGHRIDFHFTEKFQMALTEMAIYGGEDREFELAFANPMTFYYGAQRNESKGMSGLWSIDLFYKPIQKLSLYGQILIDDIIVNNDPGIDDRGRYPDRFAMMFSLRSGDLILEGMNLGLTYVKVWNDTYQSRRTWENFHYNGLGLGYPEVSCEEVHFKVDYWNFYPFYISNENIFGRYGNGDLSDIFLLEKREFPINPINNNIFNQFEIDYFLSNKVTFNFQYIYLRDKDHYRNRLGIFGKHNLKIGVDFLISKGIFPLH